MRSFAPCESNGFPPDLLLSFIFKPDIFIKIYNGEQYVGHTSELWRAVRVLEWQLDIFLSEAVNNCYLVHAGVVANQGQAIMLPGESGSGKSSLTLALLKRGYSYFSDELAVVNPLTAQVTAFPKPFSLKAPRLFPTLARQKNLWFGPASFEPEPYSNLPEEKRNRRVWYIHPEDVRAGSVAQASLPIRYIIFPKYQAQDQPQLEPLPANLALRKLIKNSVNLANLSEGSLGLLAKLVKEAQCFTLTVNDLEQTPALIDSLVGAKAQK